MKQTLKEEIARKLFEWEYGSKDDATWSLAKKEQQKAYHQADAILSLFQEEVERKIIGNNEKVNEFITNDLPNNLVAVCQETRNTFRNEQRQALKQLQNEKV